MENYYYNRLNKAQQNAYHAMKTGLQKTGNTRECH